MTNFQKDEYRHFCRNPKCRTKLKAPVSNRREAFCARGCHTSFYLKCCLFCEQPLQRRNKTQRVCRKRRCRNAWRAKAGFGRYVPFSSVSLGSKSPGFVGSKSPPKPDRAWRRLAGPELNLSQLHCATVGANEAVAEATQKNRRYWHTHNANALIVGGYKFPNAPDVKCVKKEER